MEAFQQTLPELDAPRGEGTATESDDAAIIPPLEAEPELDQATLANADLTEWTEAADDDRDLAPELPAPTGGERWFCYTDELSTRFAQEPQLVLTREAPTDRPSGEGQILIAGVVNDAQFSIEGIERRWDWSDNLDTIVIDPGGSAAYYDFRRLEEGETRLERPTSLLWCRRG